MLFKEGDTFLYRYPKQAYHLFLVVTNIISVNGVVQYVCPMVSSWKDGSKYCDPACILNAGDHPFIEHKSYVAYRETIILKYQTKDMDMKTCPKSVHTFLRFLHRPMILPISVSLAAEWNKSYPQLPMSRHFQPRTAMLIIWMTKAC